MMKWIKWIVVILILLVVGRFIVQSNFFSRISTTGVGSGGGYSWTDNTIRQMQRIFPQGNSVQGTLNRLLQNKNQKFLVRHRKRRISPNELEKLRKLIKKWKSGDIPLTAEQKAKVNKW